MFGNRRSSQTYRALLWTYRVLLQIYRDLLRIYQAILRMYIYLQHLQYLYSSRGSSPQSERHWLFCGDWLFYGDIRFLCGEIGLFCGCTFTFYICNEDRLCAVTGGNHPEIEVVAFHRLLCGEIELFCGCAFTFCICNKDHLRAVTGGNHPEIGVVAFECLEHHFAAQSRLRWHDISSFQDISDRYARGNWLTSAQEPYISANEPCISAKEPHTSTPKELI